MYTKTYIHTYGLIKTQNYSIRNIISKCVCTYVFVVELDHNFVEVRLEVVVVPISVVWAWTRCHRQLK